MAPHLSNVSLDEAYSFSEPMPVEQLVTSICDYKQAGTWRVPAVQQPCTTTVWEGYTQFGGLRPFGVSFLVAGYDVHHGFQQKPKCTTSPILKVLLLALSEMSTRGCTTLTLRATSVVGRAMP